MSQSEVEKFFSELPSENKSAEDIFGQDQKPSVPEKVEGKVEEKSDEEVHKNRKHRRWESRLEERERELIAREARIQALQEKEENQMVDNTDARLLRVFGDSEQGKEIAYHFSQILAEKTAEAREQAIQEFENRQVKEYEEQRGYESFIDENLENLEDKYNIDLTSDSPKARKARREYLELVGKLSPKDEDGNITAYADFESTFEMYKSSSEKPNESINRAKEIAGRTMQRSGAGTEQVPTGPMNFARARREINKQFGN